MIPTEDHEFVKTIIDGEEVEIDITVVRWAHVEALMRYGDGGKDEIAYVINTDVCEILVMAPPKLLALMLGVDEEFALYVSRSLRANALTKTD